MSKKILKYKAIILASVYKMAIGYTCVFLHWVVKKKNNAERLLLARFCIVKYMREAVYTNLLTCYKYTIFTNVLWIFL